MFQEYYASTYLVTLEMKKIIERMIALGLLYSIDKKGFREPIQYAQPWYKMPEENTVLQQWQHLRSMKH